MLKIFHIVSKDDYLFCDVCKPYVDGDMKHGFSAVSDEMNSLYKKKLTMYSDNAPNIEQKSDFDRYYLVKERGKTYADIDAKLYDELSTINLQLDKDFQAIDVIDLEFYERWLNG